MKGGEGFFKRPTGIAIDSAAQRIYITDTLRDKVFVLDMNGSVLQTIGKRGNGEVEFDLPTELLVRDRNLFVVDAMNFRVQYLDRSGVFQTAVGQLGDSSGSMFRPKGIAVDSEGHLYVVDGMWAWCRSSISREGCSITSGVEAHGAESFSCPQGCSSIIMTASL